MYGWSASTALSLRRRQRRSPYDLYVDGSKIARNPTQPSTGIATLGKPFVLGATRFDEQFGQGFYGWIGDTRIVGRPPSPRQFLTPFE